MCMDTHFILKGNIFHSLTPREIAMVPDGLLVCDGGISGGIYAAYSELPRRYQTYPIKDMSGMLIIPGMSDLHVHAPQYTFRGLGMDMELLEWLGKNAFPEEARYKELDYADKAYGIFVEDLIRSATTRAAIFATVHVPATRLLMDKLEASGLVTCVGKVNMDRNSDDTLREATAGRSLEATEQWIYESIRAGYRRTQPIITPRFTPSCSDELMEGLGRMRVKYHLPVQSHLSENYSEIEWVKELCPWSSCYADAYDRFGLLGDIRWSANIISDGTNQEYPSGAIMAHCVHCTEEEIRMLKERGTYIAHCPQSNINIASGAAPVRTFLDRGMKVGLGTDIAGGASISLFRTMVDAISVSKLRWRLVDQALKPLTFEEAFYMATAGGGEFFGRVGRFEKGYEFDALVIDDSRYRAARVMQPRERLERFIYLAEGGGDIVEKYVAGREILNERL